MEFSEQLRLVWRRRWWILGLTLLVAANVYAWSDSKPDVYRAGTTLQVASVRANGDAAKERAEFVAQSYATLVPAQLVAAPAARNSGLGISGGEAAGRLSASTQGTPGFLSIVATGPTPEAAAALANGAARAVIDLVEADDAAAVERNAEPIRRQIDALNEEIEALGADDPATDVLQQQASTLLSQLTQAQLAQRTEFRVTSEAFPPSKPISPKPRRDATLAFVVMLLANAQLAVVVEALSGRFSSSAVTERELDALGLKVLAEIPSRRSEAAEAFRELRASVEYLRQTGGYRSFAIVSVEQGAGKSHTAVGLSQAMASLGEPTVVIDCDLRRPTVHARLGMTRSPGLGDAFLGADVDKVVRTAPDSPLRVLTAGGEVADPSGLLGSAFGLVLDQLRWADALVVDTPPVGLFADGAVVARQCDATIFVINVRSTKRDDVRHAVERLRQLGADPKGVVLNRTKTRPRVRYDRRGYDSGADRDVAMRRTPDEEKVYQATWSSAAAPRASLDQPRAQRPA